MENRIKPRGGPRASEPSDGKGGSGGLSPRNFLNLRCLNIAIQQLLLPREKKISDYSGRKM